MQQVFLTMEEIQSRQAVRPVQVNKAAARRAAPYPRRNKVKVSTDCVSKKQETVCSHPSACTKVA
nr:hypothetical protein [Ectobacillus panaciterrae]